LGRFDDYERVALHTPNLVLEPLTPAHADEIFPHLGDPALYTYVPQDPPPDIDRVRRFDTPASTRPPADGLDLWLNWVIKARGQSPAPCRRR
jgi:hypothetical protein